MKIAIWEVATWNKDHTCQQREGKQIYPAYVVKVDYQESGAYLSTDTVYSSYTPELNVYLNHFLFFFFF